MKRFLDSSTSQPGAFTCLSDRPISAQTRTTSLDITTRAATSENRRPNSGEPQRNLAHRAAHPPPTAPLSALGATHIGDISSPAGVTGLTPNSVSLSTAITAARKIPDRATLATAQDHPSDLAAIL